MHHVASTLGLAFVLLAVSENAARALPPSPTAPFPSVACEDDASCPPNPTGPRPVIATAATPSPATPSLSGSPTASTPSTDCVEDVCLRRPTSVQGYQRLLDRLHLELELATARPRPDEADLTTRRRELRVAERWYEQDTTLTSQPMTIAGILMLGFGGMTAVGGTLVALTSEEQAKTATVVAAVGAGAAAAGVPLIVFGAPRIMARGRSGPSGAISLGAGTFQLEGTF